MNNNKLKLIIGGTMLGVMLLLGLLSFGDIKYSPSDGLSYEEKKRDAKYLMDFLENTYPYFEEIKKESGEDILGNKNKIINSISKTSSDEDFYDSISKLFRKFTYGAAEITHNWEYFGNNFTYLDKELDINASNYREKALKGKEKWEPIQQKYWQKLYTPADVNFFYMNGNYYVNTSQNPQVHIGDQLVKVEGVPVDEYVEKMPSDKYFRTYDYTYEKYACTFNVVILKDKNSKMNITVKNSMDEEKDVEILPLDESKPFLEDGYSKFRNGEYIQQRSEEQSKEIQNRRFLNSFEDGKLITLDFLANNDINSYYNDSKFKENMFSAIDKSNGLIIDLRGGYNETMLMDILGHISPNDIEGFNYRVIKRSKVNDEFITSFRNSLNPFITEVSSTVDTLEKKYPLSEYYTFKEKKFEIKGKGQYHGKVFVLFDGAFYSDYGAQLLNTIIQNNLGTVISNSKINVQDFQYFNSITSAILPNSNIIIMINNGKTVDENGAFIGNQVVTPQVIIEKDINSVLDLFKKGEGDNFNMLFNKKYTNEDEYFMKALELLK